MYSLEFTPYVVFVKPPGLEELRLTRRRAKVICEEKGANTVRIFSVSTRVKLWGCLFHVVHVVYKARAVPGLLGGPHGPQITRRWDMFSKSFGTFGVIKMKRKEKPSGRSAGSLSPQPSGLSVSA